MLTCARKLAIKPA